MFSEFDRLAMTRALALAERGLETTHPNPRVGCVIAKGERIIAEGWHERAGEAHAEVAAIRAAKEPVAGATAYVTLEPCSHHGRTPPCVNALIEARIARVVFAVQDPNPRVSGQGADALLRAGIAVEAGLMEAEATELNIGFMKRMKHGLPWVRVKLAMSLDGRTALANGASQWITGEHARNDVQRWRARCAAVMTGVGTVLADDPQLNVRTVGFKGRQPLRVVLDSWLRSPPGAKMFVGLGGPAAVAGGAGGAARGAGAAVGAVAGAGGANAGAAAAVGGNVLIFAAAGGGIRTAIAAVASADPSDLAEDMAALVNAFETSPTAVSAPHAADVAGPASVRTSGKSASPPPVSASGAAASGVAAKGAAGAASSPDDATWAGAALSGAVAVRPGQPKAPAVAAGAPLGIPGSADGIVRQPSGQGAAASPSLVALSKPASAPTGVPGASTAVLSTGAPGAPAVTGVASATATAKSDAAGVTAGVAAAGSVAPAGPTVQVAGSPADAPSSSSGPMAGVTAAGPVATGGAAAGSPSASSLPGASGPTSAPGAAALRAAGPTVAPASAGGGAAGPTVVSASGGGGASGPTVTSASGGGGAAGPTVASASGGGGALGPTVASASGGGGALGLTVAPTSAGGGASGPTVASTSAGGGASGSTVARSSASPGASGSTAVPTSAAANGSWPTAVSASASLGASGPAPGAASAPAGTAAAPASAAAAAVQAAAPPASTTAPPKVDSPAAFQSRRAALTARGVRIEEVPADDGFLDLFAVLQKLAELEVNEVLVEAGPTLAGQLLTTFFVDELLLYIAPKLLGPQGRPLVNLPELQSLQDAWGFSVFDAKRFGEDLRLRLRPK